MTRAQFLNDLYRRLPGLTQEQAEQYLTYYAEMLNDRMEEGMSEEEAVASMEPVEVIAQRILQDEGMPEGTAQPPQYPQLPKTDGSRFTKVPENPKRKNGKKTGMAVLWAVAIVMAVTSIGRWASSHRRMYDTAVMESAVDYGIYEEPDTDYEMYGRPGGEWEYAAEGISSFDGLYDPWGMEIDSEGVHGNSFDLTSDGIFATDGGHELQISPDGIDLGGTAPWGTDGMNSVIGARYRFEDDTYRATPETVEALYVKWPAGAVLLQGWEEDYIQFQEFSGGRLKQSQKLKYSVEGGLLSIDENTGMDKGLIVWVPVHLLSSLSVDASTADIYIDQLAAESGEVDTTSGNIVLTNTAYSYLGVQTSSGDVTLRRVAAGGLAVDMTSGDIWLDAVLADSHGISTSSGNVTGYLAGTIANIGTTSGKITAKTGVIYLVLDSSSGNVTVSPQEGVWGGVEADTTSGNVLLRLPGDWGFELEFDSTSGYFDNGPFAAVRMDDWYVLDGRPANIHIEVETTSGNLRLAAQE